MRGDQQRPVGIAVRQAGDGGILVLVERVILFGSHRAHQFQGRGNGLEPDRVGGVVAIDQREIIGWNGQLVLGGQLIERGPLLGRERQGTGKLAGVADGVLRLPSPVGPLVVRDVAPRRDVEARWSLAGDWEARRRPEARFQRR